MEQNNKHLLYAGLAIIVVIAIALIVPHLKHTNPVVPVVTAPVVQTTTTASSDAPSMTYNSWTSFLVKNAHQSMVFAADCTASPIVQEQSKDVTVLLINNSAVAHVLTVANSSYTIAGYHYKPIILTTTGTNTITCDSHGDAANINVTQ